MSLPAPYYSKDGQTIYCGDCRDILPHLDPVDLVLTDPPYGVGMEYGEQRDDLCSLRKLIGEWLPVARGVAPRVLLTPGIARIWEYPPADWVLCWHKPFSVGHSPFGANNWEPVLFYGEKGLVGTDRNTDYFDATFVRREPGHPCPKPDRWAEQLLKIASHPGQTILDPFMGSGTMLMAARDLGRKCIGIEIEEKYCAIAVRRLSQQLLPFGGGE